MSSPYFTGNIRGIISAPSAASLRSVESNFFVLGEQAYVTTGPLRLEWDPASVAADDGTTVIKPNDVSGAGRWVTSTLIQAGSLPANPGAGNWVLVHDGITASWTENVVTDTVAVLTAFAVAPIPATTGAVRLSNAQFIKARNFANDGDLQLVGTDASDNLLLGASSGIVIAQLQGGQTARLAVSGTVVAQWSQSGTDYAGFGAIPATTGQIRFPKDGGLAARNAANSANLTLVAVDGSNNILVGDITNTQFLEVNAATAFDGFIGASQVFQFAHNISDFVALGAPFATAGTVRLGNTSTIQWRNNANGGNVVGVSCSTGDVVQIGGTNSQGLAGFRGATQVYQFNGGAGDFLAMGAVPAATGVIRLSNAQIIFTRNAGNTANLATVFVYSDDHCYVGNGANSSDVGIRFTSAAYIFSTATVIGSQTDGVKITSNALTWNASSSSPKFGQDAKGTDTAPQNLTLTPQAAFVTATGANRVPGSLIVALGAPTNGGTTEALFQVNRNSSHQVSFGNYFSSSLASVWIGPGITPSSTNFLFLGDGSTQVNVNVPTGGTIFLTTAGTALNGFSVTAGQLSWFQSGGDRLIQQGQRTGDNATAVFTIAGQDASAAATGTNRNGGSLNISGGAQFGAGKMGVLFFQSGSDNSGNISLFGGSATSHGGDGVLSIGTVTNTVTATAANQAVIYNNGGSLSLQADGAVSISASTTEVVTFKTDGVRLYGGAGVGSGTGVLSVHNAAVDPSTNPSNGGILYASGGAGKWRGSGGTTTTFGPAEPHCPNCGNDYVFEAENEKRGHHLAICWVCFLEEATARGLDRTKFAFIDKLGKAA